MNMKKLILTVAVMLGMCAQTKAGGFALLRITQHGVVTDYNVSDIRKITFEDGNMVLNLTDDKQERVPLEVLSTLTVGNPTGLIALEQKPTGLVLRDGSLELEADEGWTVTVYDLSGKLLRSVKTHQGKNCIDIGGLLKGTYVLKVNNKSEKFINK